MSCFNHKVHGALLAVLDRDELTGTSECMDKEVLEVDLEAEDENSAKLGEYVLNLKDPYQLFCVQRLLEFAYADPAGQCDALGHAA